MTYDLDQVIDRRNSDSAKWHRYGPDVLPLWVADMDFASPEPVIRAMRERADHGVFGYASEVPEIRPILIERLATLYGWRVEPEALIFLPGVVTSFNQAIRAVTQPGDGVLAQTPVYFPILHAPANADCTLDEMELTRRSDGQYEIDFERFEDAITNQTRIFILCNPHNPVGRVFRRDELEHMAEFCLRRGVTICSDEIHCDLVFSGQQHVPIASIAPEIAERSITLMAPSKTFNVAGLHCSFAIIPSKDLRESFAKARIGLVPGVNLMGQVAALAAYRDGQPWLDATLGYLEANRDFLQDYVNTQLPGVSMAEPEGTYLAWLDCREAGLLDNPHQFFLDQAKVAMNDGAVFGAGGEGFVRLNFACPRATLVDALQRMKAALEAQA